MPDATDAHSAAPRHPLSWRSQPLRAVLLLVALVLALRLAWGWYLGRKLNQQLAAIRARGEPVRAEEVEFADVPDAENAFAMQLRALDATTTGVDSPRSSNFTYNTYLPYPPTWWAMAAASEKAHRKVFSLMRQARSLSRVRPHGQLHSPLLFNRFPQLSRMRHLANLVGDGALYQHLLGHDQEALERSLDLLHLARSLRHDWMVVSQLVAAGLETLAYTSIQTMAPGMDLPPGSPARQTARELIAKLLDEESCWAGFERGIRDERPFELDALASYGEGTWFISPLVDLESIRINRDLDLVVQASRSRTWPAARRVLAARIPDADPSRVSYVIGPAAPRTPPPVVPRYARFFGFNPMSEGAFRIQFRVIAERRLTAVALAVRLYRLDHGRWPSALDQLVPDYVPAVPKDPYHENGRPLGYRIARGALPVGGDRPLLYFDAGPEDPAGWLNEPTYDWQQSRNPALFQGIRQYRDLERWSPPAGASPQWSRKYLGENNDPTTQP